MNRNSGSAVLPQLLRRSFLHGSGYGIGVAALNTLAGGSGQSAHAATTNGSTPVFRGAMTSPHVPPRARRVIHLCMAGGPSQHETFDWKPQLKKLHGKPFPESFTKGQQLAQLQNAELRARGSFVGFKKWGKSGQEISDLLPNIGSIADEICIVRSMHTEQINHDPAHAFMNAGSILKGRPSMGSWVMYGIGAETQNLPGFVVLVSTGMGSEQPISSRQWSAGFLPSQHQGIQFQSRGDAVHYVGSPQGVSPEAQKRAIDQINLLNRDLFADRGDPEILTRIQQYEMAFRMQTSVPELTDFSAESPKTLDDYGIKQAGDGSFASNCLLARRLAERGVRFIQLYHRAWDHHGDIETKLPKAAGQVDRASAALVRDLKQRGLLDDTLIIWGGEFGRTPMGQGTGRDHHINAFSIWMAGGGIKPGMSFGHTDELGYGHIKDGQEVAVRDLHATMLHLLGIDHTRLTVRFQGLDQKLTGVEEARVVKALIKSA